MKSHTMKNMNMKSMNDVARSVMTSKKLEKMRRENPHWKYIQSKHLAKRKNRGNGPRGGAGAKGDSVGHRRTSG